MVLAFYQLFYGYLISAIWNFLIGMCDVMEVLSKMGENRAGRLMVTDRDHLLAIVSQGGSDRASGRQT